MNFHKTSSFFPEAVLWCKLQTHNHLCWKSPSEIIYSISPAQPGSTQAGCPAPCAVRFGMSPEGDFIISLGHLLQCLTAPHGKNYLLVLHWMCYFKICASCFASRIYWDESGFLLFIPCHQEFIQTNESPLSLLIPQLKSSSCLSSSLHERHCSPLIIFGPCTGLTPVNPSLSCINCTDGIAQPCLVMVYWYGVFHYISVRKVMAQWSVTGIVLKNRIQCQISVRMCYLIENVLVIYWKYYLLSVCCTDRNVPLTSYRSAAF